MAVNLRNRNLISLKHHTPQEIEYLLDLAADLKNKKRCGIRGDLMAGKNVALIFEKPSTRTRLSFETAVQRLGGTVIGFSDAASTSTKKGETLADTVRIISSYTDAIVMRHPKEGAARVASEFSAVPIINGGDGANQHPSQTLLDLFTLHETQGRLDNLTVAFVGDLKYGRTVHSLAQALSLFGAKFYFVGPEALAMPDYLCEELDERGISYTIASTIEEVIPHIDILYMTRVQRERFDEAEYQKIKGQFVLRADMLRHARPNMKILHPLPRVDEITTDVDATPHAYYFEQAKNGVYARQALLSLVLNETV